MCQFAGNPKGLTVSRGELCTVKMKGAYPILTVADVQGQGSANVFNKVKLWDMLSVDK